MTETTELAEAAEDDPRTALPARLVPPPADRGEAWTHRLSRSQIASRLLSELVTGTGYLLLKLVADGSSFPTDPSSPSSAAVSTDCCSGGDAA